MAKSAPAPVEIVNPDPILVLDATKTTPPPKKTVTKGQGTTLAPTTTEADDKVTEGQRHINLIWEVSQAIISISVTGAVIYCQIYGITSETLNNAFFFVVATYLQRTNHVKRGGVGPQLDDEVYRGR